MTDADPLPPSTERGLADFRRRRAEMAATRAAFEERRRYGLRARHAAKLARLAAWESERDQQIDEPSKEVTPPEAQAPDAA